MGGEQATFLKPRLDPLTKIFGAEATIDERMGKIQGQVRCHQTTNDNP